MASQDRAREEASRVLRENYFPLLEKAFLNHFQDSFIHNGERRRVIPSIEVDINDLRNGTFTLNDNRRKELLLNIAVSAAIGWLGISELLIEAPAELLRERADEIKREIRNATVELEYLYSLQRETNYHLKLTKDENIRLRTKSQRNSFPRRQKYLERALRASVRDGRTGGTVEEEAVSEEANRNRDPSA